MTTKTELRESALQLRRSLGTDRLAALSLRIAENIFSLPEFTAARTVATYVGREDEVGTVPIIEASLRQGKRVIVPRTDRSSKGLRFFEIHGLGDLSPGTFGVLEPTPNEEPQVPLSESDVVLVPLLAWDDRGNRIGYGKGYFDSALPSRGDSPAVGLALEAQRVRRVPVTASDVPLDIVVTERRVVRFTRKRVV